MTDGDSRSVSDAVRAALRLDFATLEELKDAFGHAEKEDDD